MNYFFEDNTKDALKSLEEHHKRVEEREKKRDQWFEETAKNTRVLKDIFIQVRANHERSRDLLRLMTEMNEILIAKDKLEAENIFNKVINNARNFNIAVTAIESLQHYGQHLITFYK